MHRRFAWIGATAALALWLSAGCHSSAPSLPRADQAARTPAPERRRQTDPTAQDYELAPLPRARVILHDAYSGSQAVDAEVAATGVSRQRGLMWRTELPAGKGMLFIFLEEQVRSFWMKNTLIPLDLIFIGKDRRIAGIVRDAAPQTLASRAVKQPSMYVLEVPGGWAEKTGIRSGSSLEMEGISMITVQP